MEEKLLNFTDNDILFLLETVSPGLVGKIKTVKNDPDIIERMLDQESGRLFQRLMFEDGDRSECRCFPEVSL